MLFFVTGFNTLPRSTMSEPMRITDQASSVYSPDQVLETVSEERRNHENADHLSDYYYRDSFEHSSTESGFTSVLEARHPFQDFSMSDNTTQSFQHSVNNPALIIQQNATNDARIKKFSILHAFIPSFMFVVIILTATTIFMFESDAAIFMPIKRWPEMISLNYQYYQPIKSYLSRLISGTF